MDETGGHGGDVERVARDMGVPASKILDFSSNVNPLGPPPGLLNHLRAYLNQLNRYPEPQAREFRAVLAKTLGISVSRLLPGNGANDLLHLLFLWHRPRRVLLPAPSFSEYRRAAQLAGAEIDYFPLPPDLTLDQGQVEERLTKGDWLVLCNPHNPTGTLYSRNQVDSLLELAQARKATVLLDESFMSLSGCPQESLQQEQVDNLWVVVSLTKCWALPGLRLGYALGPEPEVQQLLRWGDPWRVNLLAQQAGLFCLERQEGYLSKTLDLLTREREYIHDYLQASGSFKIYPSQVNFMLARGEASGFHVEDLYDMLIQKGILIRRADNFKGLDHRYFRLAVRQRRENRLLIKAINEYVSETNK